VFEVRTYSFPAFSRLNYDESPGLAVADRGSERGEPNKMLEQSRIDGIRAKAPNIASPLEEFFKLLSKPLAELRFVERNLL
jgi:hypothetical protein